MRDFFEVITETNTWVAINKSAGVLSIVDRYKTELPNLQHLLSAKFNECFTVHRLDKQTSGVMVFALNSKMHQHLNNQFEKGLVDKVYLALVHGKPNWQQKELDAPLVTKYKKVTINKKGKASVTVFEVVERFKSYSLLKCYPKTGRTHQIRAHISYLGHPIVGDALYGGAAELSINDIKLTAKTGGRAILKRQALHASELFFWDLSGEQVKLSASLSKDFEVALKQLRKWGC